MGLLFNILISLALIFSISTAFISYEIYSSQKIISGQAFSNGELNFTVETSSASCGDLSCNGAETCSSCSADCGVCSSGTGGSVGGGGGGGGGAPATQNTPKFKLSEDNINIQIVSGNSNSNEIVIENTGSVSVTINVESTGISRYISITETIIVLAPGESKSFIFTLNAPEPGVYAGKIIFTYRGVSEEALILLNVVSEGVLFDATVTVPDLYRVLRTGQRLPVLIELTEVGDGTGVDVTMNYVIKDFNDAVKYTESETFYVEGTKSYSKRFSTTGLEPGDYVLGVELVYPGGFATSSAHFKISETAFTLQTWVAIISVFIAILAVVVSFIFFRHRRYNIQNVKRSNVK